MLTPRQIATLPGYLRNLREIWDIYLPKPKWLRGKVAPATNAQLAVYGYFLSEIGLGEAARRLVEALDDRVTAELINIPLPRRQNEPALKDRVVRRSSTTPVTLTIAAVDAVALRGAALYRNKINISYPYWELPTSPPHIAAGLGKYDQHWAPSSFIRDFLENCQSAPVHLVKQPVRIPADEPDYRAGNGPYTFLSYFDVDSFTSRKNPQGVVQAFRQAFPPSDRDVRLIVKVRGRRDDGIRTWLNGIAAEDPRITLIDRFLSREEMDDLLAASDAFVSLHRSEGFGFGPAEALLAGKPVIATDFGGTTDFITPETGFPVSWRARPLAVGEYPNGAGSHWADPDLADAAAQMRSLRDAPQAARDRARAGFALLRRNHAPEVIGAQIQALLQEISP